MAKSYKEHLFLGALFVVVLIARLYFLSGITEYDSQSYFALRQAEAIRETGTPLYDDPLSYSGRVFFFPPLFHYLTAFLGIFMPLELAAKVLVSLSLSSLIIIVYAITKHLTKSKPISYITALFTAFVPAMFINIESLTPSSLNVALTFLLSYLLLKSDEPGYASWAIGVALLSMLTSAQAFVIILGMLVYFLLLVIERIKPMQKEIELTVFISFLTIWFYVLLYKKAFFANGLSVFWNNIPLPIIQNYLEHVSFFGILYSLGIIPLFLGVYAIYNTTFENKNKQVLFYIAFATVSFGFLWLRALPLQAAIILFTINMIILSGYTLKIASVALSKTKIEPMTKTMGVAVTIVFLASASIPFTSLIFQQQGKSGDMMAMEWIRENTPEDSTILASVEEGFRINYIAQRKNVADENFLFQRYASQTYNDISEIYNLKLSSEAIRIASKHNTDYIIITSRTKQKLNITRLFYDDSSCFSQVYGNESNFEPIIYEFKNCTITAGDA